MRKPLYKKTLLTLLAAVAVVCVALAIRFLNASRPFIGGVDFYYYVLFARDLASGATDVPLARYIYFPGVYSFWKTVFRVSDGSLPSLQWAYVGVLLANGILIGGILTSLTRIWQAGVFASALYIFIASRIEGLYGVTEPIATIPFLTGLWLWVLLSERGRTTAGLLALASGFGLALYVKQHGGFLALGALGLLPALTSTAPTHKYRIAHLLILPVTATCVFLLAMWLEGGGISAVKTGLLFARNYSVEGSWLQHVNAVREITRPISSLFLSGCALWLILVIFRDRIPVISDAALLTLGLSIFSALGCLLQFSKRGYLHYAMLLLPSAIIAAGLAIDIIIALLRWHARRWPRFAAPAVLAGIAAFLLINSAGTSHLVTYVFGQITSPTRWMRNETVGKTFAPLCSHVRPGTDLLLIPSHQNIVHWFCQTRSMTLPVGYGWLLTDADSYLAAASSPPLSSILVFSEHAGEYEKFFFGKNDRDQLIRQLERLGFRETFSFEAGQLYQRTRPPQISRLIRDEHRVGLTLHKGMTGGG